MRIEYHLNQTRALPSSALALTNLEALKAARRFHRTLPGYRPTPLVSLQGLADKLGTAQILVKDESPRFGLNAFKALGGSYAIARCLGERLGLAESSLTFAALTAPEAKAKLGKCTFVTATDGNHGRGVAWAARLLGHDAVVYLPKGSAQERLNNIRAEGARAEITDLNYDDAVRWASEQARQNGWILVQDTAWPGYEIIPAWILQGYGTIALEIADELKKRCMAPPTHVFLQAGVGSFAGSMLGSFAALWGESAPKTCIVEPEAANCLYLSAKAGQPTPIAGSMNSMMAGLCCGEPCTISWELLRCGAAAFVACEDGCAAHGMRLLGRPTPPDPVIVSGESGAVGIGLLAAVMREPALCGLRRSLGLNGASRVLCISTEGATDRKNYRAVLATPD